MCSVIALRYLWVNVLYLLFVFNYIASTAQLYNIKWDGKIIVYGK